MLFQTQGFLLAFLPVTLAAWYACAQRAARREWALIACSLFFYAWWDARFVVLLLAQTLVSWGLAEIYLRGGRRSRWPLVLGIAANLAVLVFFKYWTFLAENLVAATSLALPAPTIVLPIGISFFTFEIMSYLADVGWRDAPHYPLRRFSLFVMLFPRLIAGPIVRHHEIIPQFELNPLRDGLGQRLSIGAMLLIAGLVKKVFLADALAPFADSAFASVATTAPPFQTAWIGALAFTFQLFLDFSAYSEMAIGIALMLGFTLPQNFDAPYTATSIRDFWRRWHMTLSRYLRDYVYIPLGGSREGVGRYIWATLFTMGLCGLWHGAGWTFLAWGLLHGAALLVCHAWQARGFTLPSPVAWALTFLFVVIGWVLFRAPNFGVAAAMLQGMAGLNGLGGSLEGAPLIALAAAVSMIGPTTYKAMTTMLRPRPVFAVLAASLAVIVLLEVGAGQPQTFIYFQF